MSKKVSVFDMFKTVASDEVSGVYINYGSFRVRVAYAGGANTDYNRLLMKLGRPYLKLIKSGNLPEEVAKEIDEKLYSQTIIKSFEVNVAEDDAEVPTWKAGIPTPEGEVLDLTTENLIRLLNELPHLFEDIKTFSQEVVNYKPDLEDAKGN